MEMVDELLKKGETIYICQLCGFGYRTLEAAERCEEYCDVHGSYSSEIHKQAVSKPTVRTIPLAA
jgi:rubrerythrin